MLYILLFVFGYAHGQHHFKSPFEYEGQSILERFEAPEGFEIRAYPEGSFASMLQNLSLKKNCTVPLRSDGIACPSLQGCAVVNWPIKDRPDRQCTDTVIGLWIHYLLDLGAEDEQISFTIPVKSSLGQVQYSLADWRKGIRINQETTAPEKTIVRLRGILDESNQGYIDEIYRLIYSASLSMSLEHIPTQNISSIQVGDVLIRQGHVQIILNLADKVECTDAERANCQDILVMIGDGNMSNYKGTEMRVTGNPARGPWKNLRITNGKVFGEYNLYRFKPFRPKPAPVELLPVRNVQDISVSAQH